MINFILSLFIFNLCLSSRLARGECPHKNFLDFHVCDDCSDWTQAMSSSDSDKVSKTKIHFRFSSIKCLLGLRASQRWWGRLYIPSPLCSGKMAPIQSTGHPVNIDDLWYSN